MAKSFKSRKKSRRQAPTAPKGSGRVDSTAGVTVDAPDSETTSDPSLVAAEGSEAGDETTPAPSAALAANTDAKREATAEVVEIAAKTDSVKIEAAPQSAPASKRAHGADDSGEFGNEFFAKTEAEIHEHETAAHDAFDDDLAPPPPRRHVDSRAKTLVMGIVGVAALIGLAGAVLQRATPKAASAASITQVAPEANAAPAALPPPPAAEAVVSPPPAPVAAPAPTPEPAKTAEVAPAPTVAAIAPEPVATTVSSAAAAAVTPPPAEPAADPDDALSGAQLLGKARAAISANAASRAATLAKKAIAKGAGGSAYYVLGAAYQTMGANGAAKGAYRTCAKSGCAEASECASLADGM